MNRYATVCQRRRRTRWRRKPAQEKRKHRKRSSWVFERNCDSHQVWRCFDTYLSEMVCGSAYDSKYPQFGHRNVLTGMT
jgi:hypothetical protein